MYIYIYYYMNTCILSVYIYMYTYRYIHIYICIWKEFPKDIWNKLQKEFQYNFWRFAAQRIVAISWLGHVTIASQSLSVRTREHVLGLRTNEHVPGVPLSIFRASSTGQYIHIYIYIYTREKHTHFLKKLKTIIFDLLIYS